MPRGIATRATKMVGKESGVKRSDADPGGIVGFGVLRFLPLRLGP